MSLEISANKPTANKDSRDRGGDTDGERLTIKHISTALVEFAAEKYNEQVRMV